MERIVNKSHEYLYSSGKNKEYQKRDVWQKNVFTVKRMLLKNQSLIFVSDVVLVYGAKKCLTQLLKVWKNPGQQATYFKVQ